MLRVRMKIYWDQYAAPRQDADAGGGVSGVHGGGLLEETWPSTPRCAYRPIWAVTSPVRSSGSSTVRWSATRALKAALSSYGNLGRDRQRNQGFFNGITRGVSDAGEGAKILTFLFRPQLVCISYISEARGSTEPGMMASDE